MSVGISQHICYHLLVQVALQRSIAPRFSKLRKPS
ncbi:hypothetical protein J3D61_005895 [Bacillus cereus]|nr:hypothetical protein [Bacillus cereus]